MRRCMTRKRSASRSAIRYLPRRRRRSMCRPRQLRLDFTGLPGRAPQRVEDLRLGDRPLRPRVGASWRRIVSTSGSSGIADKRRAWRACDPRRGRSNAGEESAKASAERRPRMCFEVDLLQAAGSRGGCRSEWSRRRCVRASPARSASRIPPREDGSRTYGEACGGSSARRGRRTGRVGERSCIGPDASARRHGSSRTGPAEPSRPRAGACPGRRSPSGAPRAARPTGTTRSFDPLPRARTNAFSRSDSR